MMKVFGLPDCDSTKAALKWFKQHKADVVFHDFKSEGISTKQLFQWLEIVPLEKLLNKKSTTWRGLTDAQQQTAATKDGAINLMQSHTSLIKRPVVEWNNNLITAGFEETIFNAAFEQQAGL